MKYISKFVLGIVIILLSLELVGCVPSSSKSDTKSRSARRATTNTDTKFTNTEAQNTQQTAAIRPTDEQIKKLIHQSNSTQNKKQSPKKKTKTNSTFTEREEALKGITNDAERFTDTTLYHFFTENGEIVRIDTSIVRAGELTFDNAKKLILGFYDLTHPQNTSAEATFECDTFLWYAKKLNFNDSLRQEALYQYAVCAMNNNPDNPSEAIDTLEALLDDETLNKGVKPKILCYVGQAYCQANNKNKATKYFKQLKKEFPKSEYLPLANCDAVR